MPSLAERLAPLASLTVQERYVLRGTAKAYVLPEEILEDAFAVVRLVRGAKPEANDLSAEARRAVLALLPLLEAERSAHDEKPSESASLLRSSEWVELRAQAIRCLEALDFDLLAWESTQ
jgi:hypothetical protein